MQIHVDKKIAHKPLMRRGARLYWNRGGHRHFAKPVTKPHWLLFLHDECANGDGGILYEFVRKGRKWQCVGMGRMRYASKPGREVFADKLPDDRYWHTRHSNGNWIAYDGQQAIWEASSLIDLIKWLKERGIHLTHQFSEIFPFSFQYT